MELLTATCMLKQQKYIYRSFFNCDKSHGQPLYHVNIKEFCERRKYKLLFH